MTRVIGIFSLIACMIIGCKLLIPKPELLQDLYFSQAIYDHQGQLLRLTLTPDEKYRLYTPLDKISSLLVEATLLQEDQYFFQHPGVNLGAIIKAAWQTYVMHTRSFGASTITMQVARMHYRIHTKSFTGKLWQIIKALHLELFYSKKQILEVYLNLASYGGNIEGIGAASTIYFAKPASQLNLHEALMLTVIPQNPSKRVLDSEHQQHLQIARLKLFQRWIQQHPQDNTKSILMDLPLQLTKKNLPFHSPHFVDWILRNNSHAEIISTLDLQVQIIIEKITRQYIEKRQHEGIHNAAVMLVDARNREVKALMGSANFFDPMINGQINGARSKRSPGSTLKPFIYALALDQGIIHPYTVLKDAPASFGGYNPENFDKDFLGPIRAKEALILSRNIPAIELARQLKKPTFYQWLQRAHISKLKPEQDYGLSLALGGAEVTMEELVSLYAMLANKGIWQPLRIVKNQSATKGDSMLSPEASFLTLDMLRDTPRPYSMNSAMGKQAVYWKTGTSSAHRDAWAIGIFGPYVLAVWVGDFSNESNPAFVGTTAAAPLFFNIIDAVSVQSGALPELVKADPQMNLAKVQVCEASGLLPTSYCPNTSETWFIPGKSPIAKDTIHREIAIDPKTGLRTCCINENTEFMVYEFWPSDLLKIFAQAGVQRRMPPPFNAESSSITDEGTHPQIISPQQDLFYTIRLSTADHPILFFAAADADVKTLYWFVDHDFIGSSEPDKPLAWQARSGAFSVRVVDDHGRTAMRNLIVRTVEY
jgi:penicillin-binding protein 1C